MRGEEGVDLYSLFHMREMTGVVEPMKSCADRQIGRLRWWYHLILFTPYADDGHTDLAQPIRQDRSLPVSVKCSVSDYG